MFSLPSLKFYLSKFETVLSWVWAGVSAAAVFVAYHVLIALGADLPALLAYVVPLFVPAPIAGWLVSFLGFVVGKVVAELVYLLKGRVVEPPPVPPAGS